MNNFKIAVSFDNKELNRVDFGQVSQNEIDDSEDYKPDEQVEHIPTSVLETFFDSFEYESYKEKRRHELESILERIKEVENGQ